MVQNYVAGQACCVNQYHYESQLIHTTGKTWYIVLCQHTMYVISLSNISINANVKQITRLELIFTILWGRLHFVNDVTLFVAVLSPMSNYSSITFSVTVQSNNALKKEMWTLQLPEILTLCLYVAHIDVFFARFQWYDIMTKEFGIESLVQRLTIRLSPQCGDTTYCIRHHASHGLLSLISRENVHNIR